MSSSTSRRRPTTCANNDAWLKATDLKGAWTAAGTLPASFAKLPADENWKEVKASLPGKPLPASQRPTVFVSYAAGGADSAARRAELRDGRQAPICSG